MAKKNIHVQVPTTWSKLTSEQVTHLSYLISLRLTELEFLLRFALYCAGLKPHGSSVTVKGEILQHFYKRGVGNIILSSSQLDALAKSVKWVIDEPKLMAAPAVVKGWHVPNSQLYGVSLEYYVIADTAFTQYLSTKSLEDLAPLVAALYSGGTVSDRVFAKACRRAKLLPAYQLEAIALWFLTVKQWLKQRYSAVFNGTGGGAAPQGGHDTLLDMLSALNDGRIADNEAIANADIHVALHSLNLKAKAAQDLKNKK